MVQQVKHLLVVVFIFIALFAKAQNTNSPLGVNLGGIEAWSSEWVFVNIANQSYGWFPTGQAPSWEGNLPDDQLSQDRYLKQGESGTLCIVWASQNLISGDFVLTYNGDYSVAVSSYSTNMTETSNVAGRMAVTANNTAFINIEFTANDDSAVLSDIRFTKASEESLTQTFNPDFIDDIKMFKVLRFMDFIETNYSEVTTIDDYTSANSLIQRPISIAKLVELSNDLDANPWITIPLLVDDAFLTAWAQEIGNNLKSTLTAKIELSNEVWNPQFPHDDSAAARAQKLKLPGFTGDYWVDAPIYYGYRSAQVHSIFETEFSASTNKPGLCKVVAWQAANSWSLTEYILDNYKSVSGNVVPDAVAIAPYFGGHIGTPEYEDIVEAWTIPQLFEEIFHGTYLSAGGKSAIDQTIDWTAAYRKVLDENGIGDLICYEAGQHLAGVLGLENNQGIVDLFIEANRSPQMKEAYTEYMYRLDTTGCGVVCLFTSHGKFSKWGSWGLKEHIGGDASSSPKFQSTVNYINNSTAIWEDGDCSYSSVAHPDLRADFSTSSQLVCKNSSLTFTDKSSNSPTSWEWNFGDGSSTSQLQNPTHTYTTDGKYTVTLTVDDGSGSNSITKTDWVTVYPIGNFITMQPTDKLVTDGRSVMFSVTDNSVNSTYQWYFNSSEITDATDADYIIGTTTSANVGTYYCSVSGCGTEVSDDAKLTLKATNPINQYEAEDANLTGVTIGTTYSGYTGTGYIDGSSFDEVGDKFVFTVNVNETGSYPLKIRYGGFQGKKGQSVSINGGANQNALFPAADEWLDMNFGNIELNSGVNTIEISKGWGYTSFDHIYLEDMIEDLTYTIDITATNGSVSRNPDKAKYDPDEKVTLTAIPAVGYEFDSWSGDITTTDKSIEITMDDNKSISANFTAITAGRYEAEDATLTVVAVHTNLTGYSGLGHTDKEFPAGSEIEFTVNVPSAGDYPFSIRYYNDGNKNQIVKINGTALTLNADAGEVQFPNSINSWTDLDCGNITLNEGDNTIELLRGWGWTAFDYITIVGATSSNATLSNLTVGGTTINGFNASNHNYDSVLVYGTTTAPALGATTTNNNATKVITNTTTLPGSSTVVVTAEDGTTELTYTVSFTIAAASTDATLSDLTLNGTTINGFDSETHSYNSILAYGTTTAPALGATTTDNNATKVITNTTTLPGSSTVVVTAEDGTTELIYTVNFTVAKNSDATLSNLTVGGTTINDFSSETYVYDSVLVYSTATAPALGATTTDDNATKSITNTTTLPGSSTVVVTAENGIIELTYTVNFTVEIGSSDATLSDLTIDNETIADFEAATLTYNMELAAGTTEIPVVGATENNENASSSITQATTLAGQATVVVTAQDGTESIYSIYFTVAGVIGTEAKLSSLEVDDMLISDFAQSKYNYDVELPYGTSAAVVTATSLDAAAEVVITQASALPGEATVVATAEDGTTELTYTVNFTVAVGIANTIELDASIYPNPVTKCEINIVFDSENNNDEISVIIYNISGEIVYSNTLNITFGEYKITGLDNLEGGIYLLKVSNNTQSRVFKIKF